MNMQASETVAMRDDARATVIEHAIDDVLLMEATGATIWDGDQQHESGYVVAMQGHEAIFVLADYIGDYERLVSDILDHAQTFPATGLNDGVGLWLDDGRLYVDRVLHFDEKATALHFGRAWKQYAIYDIAANQEIRLEGAR